jgi:ABC-2 type transport system permease protein
MIKLLRVARIFFWRDLRMATSYPLNFLISLGGTLMPVAVLFLPAKLVGNPQATQPYGGFLPYAIVGSGIMNFFVASYGVYASAIQSERASGTLEALLMTPIKVSTIILASTAYPFVWSTLTTFLFIGGGALIYSVPLHGSPLLALLIVALTTVIFASLGVVSASFLMVFKRGDPIRPLIGTVFFLLGDIVYPVELLPPWLKFIANLLPVTHAAGPLRAVLLQGAGMRAVFGELLVLLGYAVVLFPSSLWLFTRAVRHATRDGSLLQS